jgi:hypothetical protein
MAGLRGAVVTHTLPRHRFGFTFPFERLRHLDGTPREQFVPPSPACLRGALFQEHTGWGPPSSVPRIAGPKWARRPRAVLPLTPTPLPDAPLQH